MSIFFAALSAFSYGAADFLGGVGTRHSAVHAVLFWSQMVGLLVALALAPIIGAKHVEIGDLLWGGAAGVAGAIGISLLYHALAHTVAAVCSPTAAVVGAAIPVVAGVLLGERPGALAWVGVVLALPAIFLLSFDRESGDGQVGKALRLGFLSGVGFGAFFLCISRVGVHSGLYPLIAARCASIVAVAVIAVFARLSLRIARRGSRPTILAGSLDMIANVFYLSATRAGLLVIVTIVTALYPAPTVLLGRIVFKERLSSARIAGLVLAVAGVACIGLG